MKFDLYYEIMTPEDWDEALERRLYREVIEQIEFADQMGFSTIWFVRHHGRAGYAHSPAPEIVFGALSKVTQRVRFGFSVEVLPFHHPFYVAERVALVDLLSDGRVECGTGRGSAAERAFQLLGIDPSESKARWLESVKLLPELWTKKDVRHKGTFWNWDEPQTVVPRPVQEPHPPLWLAASSGATVAAAGDYGMGLMLSGYKSLATIRENVATYREAVASPSDQIGYVTNDRTCAATSWLCHDADDDTMRQRMRAALIGWARRDVTLGRGKVGPQAVDLGGQRADLTEEQLFDDDTGIIRVGDPDYFINTARRYADAGLDHIILQMQLSGLAHEDTMRSIELFGKSVIPTFDAPSDSN